MTKVALLVPYESILQAAEKVIDERHYKIDYKKVIRTEDSVNEARMAIKAGARIIIARGLQAKLIKEYTNIPIVEMRFHSQEIGLLLKRAKAILAKENPVIGLIVFSNMLCNMTHMEELFDVKLHIRNIEKNEEIPGILNMMREQGVELIIGGELVCREAQMAGFAVLPYESTEESVAEALQVAERMSYAAETEKETKAQFETVLDTAFHGIIKVDAGGRIITLNRLVENLIGKTASDVEGKEFREVFPWLGEAVLTDVLSGKGKIIPRHCSFRANHGYFLPLLYSMMNRYPEPLYRSSVWRILQEAAKKRFRMYIFRVLQPKKHFAMYIQKTGR